ncbi:hypothetical protein D9758_000416 [Tetrapyrgos nigripes]|uniref:CCHC-type domain-containing protein n=1 Tax=Tetrapyrgos nigripes TaxID=182062 RepID=A0A8H5H1Y9_9AGAR|nr:hypothetical protein D9758_000416 [Tetrapyrgos nigripes]
MTRVTNFGIKRTYVEAGFDNQAVSSAQTESNIQPSQEPTTEGPPKKKKRTKKAKKNEDHTTGEDGLAEQQITEGTTRARSLAKKGFHNRKSKGRESKLPRSEQRRQKRIDEKKASTTCFACREQGHSAKECPKAGNGDRATKVVGMCYRCGSTRHTLSRCKKPEDPLDPLPYASCFVCSGKGHLASSCPQNKDKGVYPNGGCCKLCGETTHLAKDCELRKKDTNSLTRVIGLDENVGADEDDFHAIGRTKLQLDKDEKAERLQQSKNIKVVKSFAKPAAPKKVVYF